MGGDREERLQPRRNRTCLRQVQGQCWGKIWELGIRLRKKLYLMMFGKLDPIWLRISAAEDIAKTAAQSVEAV